MLNNVVSINAVAVTKMRAATEWGMTDAVGVIALVHINRLLPPTLLFSSLTHLE